MVSRSILGLLTALALSSTVLAKSPFVDCSVRTGQNASVFLQAEINPTINGSALESGDEIVVVDHQGICVGKAIWEGSTLSVTVWGDDEMTPEKDGLEPGEQLKFLVYDESEHLVYQENSAFFTVEYDAAFPFNGDGVYETDALYSLAKFEVVGDAVVPEPPAVVQDGFSLSAPAPNPFNPSTAFSLELTQDQEVTIRVYNALGQQISSLYDGFLPSGNTHRFRFDGSYYPSGIYLFRVRGETFAAVRSVVLIK